MSNIFIAVVHVAEDEAPMVRDKLNDISFGCIDMTLWSDCKKSKLKAEKNK